MRLLGIDYGSKRVGIALSDDAGAMGFPREVLSNDGALLSKVEKIIEEERVDEIVVGHSLDREGGDNPIHEKTKEFIGELSLRTPIPIHLEPEQYTTQEAVRFQGKNEYTDASAAAIILNSYITRKEHENDHD